MGRKINNSNYFKKIMNNLKISTTAFAHKVALSELKKRGFAVIQSECDFIVNEKRINIRGCNHDNPTASRGNILGGWDKLNPKKFDYLICVSFDGAFNDVRYFIFTKKEVWGFSNKKCVLLRNDEYSNRIIKNSENKWKKIV